MKKKTILIFLLTIVTLTMTAQDKLIRVDSESLAWQKDDPQYWTSNHWRRNMA